jgi:ribonuclease D
MSLGANKLSESRTGPAAFPFAPRPIPYIRRVIDTEEKLEAFLPQLRGARWIALDTEADSLHAYPEKLCLIQVSIADSDRLVDPLSKISLDPFLEVLRQHELILHGADYDLRLLRRDCGFVPTKIFDTMFAARLLGCREFGLGSLVAKFMGVTLEKGPQKANWARRPLTKRMEDYAQNDTRYLKPLADILSAQLKERGQLSWHQQSCAQLVEDCSVLRSPDPDLVWRLKGSHLLSPGGLAVLRSLWNWREKEAIQANRPPYFVLAPEIMVTMASLAANGGEFAAAIPAFLTPRRRKGVMHAVAEGLEVQDKPSPLRRKGHRLGESQKRRLTELERRRNRRAEELGIDPTIVASRATMVALAADWAKHVKDLLPWQRELMT